MIDEQSLRDLGFDRYNNEWEPDGWVLDLPGGEAEYVQSRWDDRWKLRIWSGTGGGDTYGFKIPSPTERRLRLVVQSLTGGPEDKPEGEVDRLAEKYYHQIKGHLHATGSAHESAKEALRSAIKEAFRPQT